jgi:hypothetical protein
MTWARVIAELGQDSLEQRPRGHFARRGWRPCRKLHKRHDKEPDLNLPAAALDVPSVDLFGRLSILP